MRCCSCCVRAQGAPLLRVSLIQGLGLVLRGQGQHARKFSLEDLELNHLSEHKWIFPDNNARKRVAVFKCRLWPGFLILWGRRGGGETPVPGATGPQSSPFCACVACVPVVLDPVSRCLGKAAQGLLETGRDHLEVVLPPRRATQWGRERVVVEKPRV